MKIVERQIGSAVILDLEGRMVHGENTNCLHDTVMAFVARGKKNIVLNLAEVSRVNQTGLGEIMRCYTATNRARGRLLLLKPCEQFRVLLAITKLLTLFDVYDNEKEALASCGAPLSPPAA